MENISDKAFFLRNDLIERLRGIDPSTKPSWGKMNVVQMIEHMSYSLRQANGRESYACVTPEENLPRMQAFLVSGFEAFRAMKGADHFVRTIVSRERALMEQTFAGPPGGSGV